MRAVLLAVNLLLPVSAAASPPPEPGVSLELAQWRAKHYRDIRYALRIHLAEGAESVKGKLEITAKLPRKPVDLVLDWRGAPVRDVRVNDVSILPEVDNDHLIIGRQHLKGGKNTVRLTFESPVAVQGSAVTRYTDREDGSEYVYTLLVPADASALFPCFDQPDLKARFSLELDLPDHWQAVSNGGAEKRLPGSIKFRQNWNRRANRRSSRN